MQGLVDIDNWGADRVFDSFKHKALANVTISAHNIVLMIACLDSTPSIFLLIVCLNF